MRHNTNAVEIEVVVILAQCEFEIEQEGVNIIVPKSLGLCETIQYILQSNNDHMPSEASGPAFRQAHLAIVAINLGIVKGTNHVTMMYIPAMCSDLGNHTPKSDEFSDIRINYSVLYLFLPMNY